MPPSKPGGTGYEDLDTSGSPVFIKSFGRHAKDMVMPILHPIDTAKSLGLLASGAVEQVKRKTGYKTGAVGPREKLAADVGHEIIRPYSSRGQFMDTLRNDPARFLFDIGSIPLPESKLGIAGKGTRAARIATNPVMTVGTVARTAGKAAKAAQIKAKGGIYSPKTGQWSQAALKAVREATEGRVSARDLQANPAFAQALIATMKVKGINPEAVKEAILAHHGAPTPRSRITGRAPHIDSAAAAADAAKAGKQIIAERVGTPPPNASELGRALDEAVTDSHNNVNHLYARATSGPEIFRPAAEPILVAEMDKALDAAGFTNFRGLPSARGAREADRFVRSELFRLAQDDALTPAAVEGIRQELNILWAGSRSPTDRNILNAMKDGLDKGMEEAATNNFLAAGNPTTFLGDLRDARAAHQQHKLTFEQSGPIGNAVRQLDKQPGANGLFVPSGDDGLYTKAQNTLVKGIVGERGNVQPGGLDLFNRLEKDILASDPSPLHTVLKDTIGHFDPSADKGAAFKVPPGNTQKFVDSPVGQSLYTPEEAANVNLGAEGRRILDTTPPSAVQNAGIVSNALDVARGAISRAATGAGAGALMGNPLIGAGVNTVLGATKKRAASRRILAKELSGAPDAFPIAAGAEKVGAKIEGASRPYGAAANFGLANMPQEQPAAAPALAPTAPPAAVQPAPAMSAAEEDWDSFSAPAEASAPQEEDWDSFSAPTPERQPRAAGGKVESIEHLVAALMNKAKAARRASNASTKPLLGVHDDAIASALAVAQKAL